LLKTINVKNEDKNAFGYLYDEIVPTLFIGVQELAKEVEYY